MARRADEHLAKLQSLNALIASHGYGKPIADAVGLANELLAALDAVISAELANYYPADRLPILDDTIARTQRTFTAILDAIARQLADKGIGLADSTAYRNGLGAAYAASLAFWQSYRGTSTDGAAPRAKPTDRAAYRDWYISIASDHEAAVRAACNHAMNDVLPRLRAILGGKAESTTEATAPQYVTLDKIAAIVGKGKKTLARKKNDPKSTMPSPAIEGGGGRADEWIWDTQLREWLEGQFNRKMPAQFPSLRFVVPT